MISMPLIKYTLTFNVTDEAEEAIEGALITINDEQISTDENGAASIELPLDNYTYSVSKEGYLLFEGEVEVTEDVSVNVTLEAIEYFTITFNVTDESEVAIEGALISINDEQISTDENGAVSIELQSGAYAYSISKEGYLVFEGEVEVTEDVSVDITLEAIEYFTITFTVTKADETAIEGASITINSELLITNEQGMATIELLEGEYPYTVSKDGFEEVRDRKSVV